MPRILKIDQLVAVSLAKASIVALILFAFPAHAKPIRTDKTQSVRELAATHCALWLRQLQGRQEPLGVAELSALFERPVSEYEAGRVMALEQGQPYFGFVTGDLWQRATRVEQQNFNFYFGQLAARDAGLHPNAATKPFAYCRMNLSLSQLKVPSDVDAIGPEPARLLAIADTFLPGRDKDLAIQYRLEERSFGWDIADIRAGAISIDARYGRDFYQLVRHSGYDGAVRQIIEKLRAFR